MICPECYSEHKRITPLLKPEECLRLHVQYICGTCGRCICANATKTGLFRWNFPFTSLEIATYYLRVADVIQKLPCGIYELKKKKRVFYKIFIYKIDMETYLTKHKDTTCDTMEPVFQMPCFIQYPNTQMRKLSDEEVREYMKEQLHVK